MDKAAIPSEHRNWNFPLLGAGSVLSSSGTGPEWYVIYVIAKVVSTLLERLKVRFKQPYRFFLQDHDSSDSFLKSPNLEGRRRKEKSLADTALKAFMFLTA